MAITDLTGTTWVFNDTIPDVAISKHNGTFNINFTSDNMNCNNLQLTTNGNILYYYNGNILHAYLSQEIDSERTEGWANENRKTIYITGGTDVTNTNLIKFITTYATQQEISPSTDTKPIFKRINGTWVKQDAFQRVSGAWVRISSKEEVIEDALAGTWVFNDTFDYNSFVEVTGATSIEVNFTSNGNDYFGIATEYKPNGLKYIITPGTSDVESVYVASTNTWVNEAYKTITITSKLSEVTYYGDTLLSWLQANATKQTTTTPTLINFRIAGKLYRAKEGMTWRQWCNSSYNTGRYSTDNAYIYAFDVPKVVSYNDSPVLPNDIIINNNNYSRIMPPPAVPVI